MRHPIPSPNRSHRRGVWLVAGAGWLVQSFERLHATSPGFVPAGRLMVDVHPNPQTVRNAGQTLAAAGAGIGLAAAYAGGRTVSSMVYGVQASDPIVLASATVVVAAITLVATAIPARRASRTDPVLVLRGG
jgi:hypothetical protein